MSQCLNGIFILKTEHGEQRKGSMNTSLPKGMNRLHIKNTTPPLYNNYSAAVYISTPYYFCILWEAYFSISMILQVFYLVLVLISC